MPTYRYPRIHASEITPEEVWHGRRDWIKAAGAALTTGARLAAGWFGRRACRVAINPQRQLRSHGSLYARKRCDFLQ